MTSKPTVNRRKFISSVAATSAAGAALTATAAEMPFAGQRTGDKFKLKFAPHPGSFRSAGKDVVDQIKYCHDLGFTAFEHNGLNKMPVDQQQRIGDTLEKLGMTMGVFVAYAEFVQPTFARQDKDKEDEILAAIKSSVEVAKRARAKWVTVVPGSIDQPLNNEKNKYGGPRIAGGYQLANVIDLLRRCADVLEPHGIVMVLEPLNWFANHGGAFLRYSDQAFAVCRAVDSPSCKILFDIYHQQINEGNLIPNIDQAWDEIAYFQAGDNPGRLEPGTGEINYANVFQRIHQRATAEGKEFVIGMEHKNSIAGQPGEEALLAAYRAVDVPS